MARSLPTIPSGVGVPVAPATARAECRGLRAAGAPLPRVNALLFESPEPSGGPSAGRTPVSASPDGQAGLRAEAEETSGETPRRGPASPQRRYYLLLKRSRLLAVAFWAATGYFFFWAIPWFPGGLSENDYTGRVALTVILGGGCAILGVGTLILRESLRRTKQALLAWTTVYDETTGLYNRRYFYDRLSLECERARRQGTTFSLFVMHFEHGGRHGRGPSAGGLRRLAGALTGATRLEDMVALLGGNELAVVAMAVSRKMVPQVTERLKSALEGSLVDSGDRLNLRLGAATYGARCRDPSTLLRLARGPLDERPAPGGTKEKEDLVA